MGGGGGHVPHLGTEDGTSIPRGGAGKRALEVRGQDVADFAPEIAAAPWSLFPWETNRPGVTPGRSGRSSAKFSGNVLQG